MNQFFNDSWWLLSTVSYWLLVVLFIVVAVLLTIGIIGSIIEVTYKALFNKQKKGE